MCRVSDGYYRSIHEPGYYDVYRRLDGTYMYVAFHMAREFPGKVVYRINVNPKRKPTPKYEQGRPFSDYLYRDK